MNVKNIVVGNWKMNPLTLEEAKCIVQPVKRLAAKLRHTKVVLCPPILYMAPIQSLLKTAKTMAIGVQDIFWNISGAYTGEISPLMVYELGGRYAIIGHSERRALGETDEVVSMKTLLALKANLSAIVCVGEKEHDREGKYLEEVRNQIRASLLNIPKRLVDKLLIAYEPVWAIGRSEEDAMKPEELEAMAIFIRKTLKDIYGEEGRDVKVLYGGSVSPENAALIVKRGNVEGLLVGHQSLSAEHFNEILRSVDGL